MLKLLQTWSVKSSPYICHPVLNCLLLFRQMMPWALDLALLRAGSSIAARMAMMAITTSNSMSVNARQLAAENRPEPNARVQRLEFNAFGVMGSLRTGVTSQTFGAI